MANTYVVTSHDGMETEVVADSIGTDGLRLTAIRDGEVVAGFNSWAHYLRKETQS